MYKQAGIDLSGTINIAGTSTHVDAYGLISIVGTDIVVKPTKLELSNSSITGQIPDAIEAADPQAVHLHLPPQLAAAALLRDTGRCSGAESERLIVQGVAKNISFSGSANSQ